MTSEICVVHAQGPGFIHPGHGPASRSFNNECNDYSPAECYQNLLWHSPADVIIYCHDDVTIHDDQWIGRIMGLFKSSPRIAAVGLGGALGLGHPDLYKKPYDIRLMARQGYRSNQTDAEVHGQRFEGTCRVAVLDAFVMAVRRRILCDLGGWPTKHLTHHCLDLWLACALSRLGLETWLVGSSCTHHGGGTSIKESYQKAKWLQGGTTQSDHAIPHRWLYEEYPDVLPIQITVR